MFESVWRKASKGKKSEKGEGAKNPMVSTCSVQLCIGVWKDLTLWAALVFGWEGREDPAILPLADGIFHLFVTLMAVLWRSFVPEPQRCLENAGPVLVRDVSPDAFWSGIPFHSWSLHLSGNKRKGNRWFSDKHNYFMKFPEEQTHPDSITRHPINAADVVFSVKEKSSVQIRIRMLVLVSFCRSVCRCCWVARVPLWPRLQMLFLSNHHLHFPSSVCDPPHGGGECDKGTTVLLVGYASKSLRWDLYYNSDSWLVLLQDQDFTLEIKWQPKTFQYVILEIKLSFKG